MISPFKIIKYLKEIWLNKSQIDTIMKEPETTDYYFRILLACCPTCEFAHNYLLQRQKICETENKI